MRLVEGVGGELLPVGPDLLEDLRIVSVLHTTVDELRLHGVNDILFLLTHRLTQGVALTTGEVGELARQQHHLLLIHRDTIGILQVFLHAVDVVFDLLTTVLTGDEGRDIVHRSWTVESIHGDEVLEHRGMQFTQVFLHACRLKLERADGLSLLVEFVGLGIIDGDRVEIHVDASCALDIRTSLLQLREGFQTEEVHLDESCRFDHVTVVLCAVGLRTLEVWVIGRRDRHMVRDRITADDEATGMDTRAAHRALEHLRIFDGVRHLRIGRGLSLLQFTHGLDGIGEVHLRRLAIHIRQTVRDRLTQGVRVGQRQFLHTCHVLDGVLRRHRGVGDDMGAVLMTVLVHHPFQHLSATVVVEVGIDIRQ